MQKKLLASLMLIFTALACSTDEPRLTQQLNSSYDYFNFTKYHQNRDTLVIIHGYSLGIDLKTFAVAVTNAMQSAHSGVQTNFTITPSVTAEKNLRVVLAFNTSPEGLDMCQTSTFKAPTTDGITSLRAAWCWGSRTDSEVTAYITPITSIGDPRFTSLLAQVTAELFPSQRNKTRDRRKRYKAPKR